MVYFENMDKKFKLAVKSAQNLLMEPLLMAVTFSMDLTFRAVSFLQH